MIRRVFSREKAVQGRPAPNYIFASLPHWPRSRMVLPVRIELTTSALPRMRSTTELRQHFVRERRAYGGGPRARQPVAGPRRERHVDEMAEKDKEREERLAAALRE